ncbi:MAG: tetratricopeptide repeat protein [Chloroflexota bacterium]
MTTEINVRLLGTCTVTFRDEPLQFRTDKIKGLFAYLLLHPAAPVRREKLATLLWPHGSDRVARKNLRDALFHLRKTLDRCDPALSQHCLIATRKTVTMHMAGRFDVDTVALAVPDPTADLAPLIGGELLAGFYLEDAEPFMEWLLLERSRWHDLSVRLLSQWAEQHLQQKEAELAQPLAQKQLGLEPWNEAAHRQALSAYGLARDWAGVAQQYKRCEDVLQAEFGIDPSSATKTLYQELLKQQRALLTPKHNLPTALSPFVGRKRELIRINSAIEHRDYRLFTLTGIGGSGKTRLALEVGQQQLGHFPDGVWFVPLASADHVEDVLPAIASAIELQLVPGMPLPEQLYADLADKTALLILDNLEQLPEEIADVVLALLNETKQLVVVTTTRSRLNLRAENIFPIEGLAFPEADETADLDQFEAIKLFAGQAARVRFDALEREDYGTIGDICRLLVGSPLAIELAAAQTQTYAVSEIAATLRDSVATLATTMRDVPPRQRSMRAVFDYSWRLLNEAQQRGLARLALFRQPFLAEAARAVAQISRRDLAVLTKSSWLRVGENGRYLFHELLREFGLARLQQQPAWLETTQQTYLAYHLHLLRDQKAALNHDLSGETLLQLRLCRADLAQAWHLGVARGAFAKLNESVAALGRFYKNSGLLLEGTQLLQDIIDSVRQHGTQAVSAPVLPALLANLLFQQARVHAEMTTDGRHIKTLQEVVSLAEQIDNPQLALEAQLNQIDILCRLSQFDEAYRRVQPIYQAAKTQVPFVVQARILNLMGNISSEKQQFVQSETHFRQALAILEKTSEPMLAADVRHNLANTLTMMGQFPEARQLHEATLQVWEQADWPVCVAEAQVALADVVRRQGEYDLARSYLYASLQVSEPVKQMHGIANARLILGQICMTLGELDQAEHHYQQLLQARQRIGDGRELFQGWAGLAEVALRRGQIARARRWIQAILPVLLADKISGEDAFWVFWVCYRVLAQVDAMQAEKVLALAVRKLLTEAELLTDPLKKEAFLHGVENHRGLLLAVGMLET